MLPLPAPFWSMIWSLMLSVLPSAGEKLAVWLP